MNYTHFFSCRHLQTHRVNYPSLMKDSGERPAADAKNVLQNQHMGLRFKFYSNSIHNYMEFTEYYMAVILRSLSKFTVKRTVRIFCFSTRWVKWQWTPTGRLKDWNKIGPHSGWNGICLAKTCQQEELAGFCLWKLYRELYVWGKWLIQNHLMIQI